MRELTIQRRKAYAASLMKMQVYMETPLGGDTVISGVRCRKLGDLKNGETKTFQIPEEALKVVVITDNLSKGMCNDFYQLPAGTEPVSLTGQCQVDPIAGNAFRFDGNNSEAAVANRKKNRRKMIPILILSVIVGLIIGILPTLLDTLNADEPQVFNADGMQITLTQAFDDLNDPDFAGFYGSRDMAVFVNKEPLYTLEGLDINTVEDYAHAVIEVNELQITELKTHSAGVPYIEYEQDVDGEMFHYTAVFYKSVDAYWTLYLAVPSELQAQYSEFIDAAITSVQLS